MSAQKGKTSSIDLIAHHLTRVEREMNKKFEQIDSRFESVDHRFDRLEQGMYHRFEGVDDRFEMIEHTMAYNHSEVMTTLDAVIKKWDRLDKERLVHTHRLDRLEHAVFPTK